MAYAWLIKYYHKTIICIFLVVYFRVPPFQCHANYEPPPFRTNLGLILRLQSKEWLHHSQG